MQVYKDIWKPSIGDKLACEREFDNCADKFAIKVVNNGDSGPFTTRVLEDSVVPLRFLLYLIF